MHNNGENQINPNFTGKWKANLENSRLFGPIPKELFITISHSEPDLRFNSQPKCRLIFPPFLNHESLHATMPQSAVVAFPSAPEDVQANAGTTAR